MKKGETVCCFTSWLWAMWWPRAGWTVCTGTCAVEKGTRCSLHRGQRRKRRRSGACCPSMPRNSLTRGGRHHPGQPHLGKTADRGLSGGQPLYFSARPTSPPTFPGGALGSRRGPPGPAAGGAEPDGTVSAGRQPGLPFRRADEILAGEGAQADLLSWTSTRRPPAKGAMAWYLDGRCRRVGHPHPCPHRRRADPAPRAQGLSPTWG